MYIQCKCIMMIQKYTDTHGVWQGGKIVHRLCAIVNERLCIYIKFLYVCVCHKCMMSQVYDVTSV